MSRRALCIVTASLNHFHLTSCWHLLFLASAWPGRSSRLNKVQFLAINHFRSSLQSSSNPTWKKIIVRKRQNSSPYFFCFPLSLSPLPFVIAVQMLEFFSLYDVVSRTRSKGSRFTLGVWGLRVCSLDVAQPSATARNWRGASGELLYTNSLRL